MEKRQYAERGYKITGDPFQIMRIGRGGFADRLAFVCAKLFICEESGGKHPRRIFFCVQTHTQLIVLRVIFCVQKKDSPTFRRGILLDLYF